MTQVRSLLARRDIPRPEMEARTSFGGELYDRLMADIKKEALEKARLEVKAEVEDAQAKVAEATQEKDRAIAERDAARGLQIAAEAKTDALRDTVSRLQKDIEAERANTVSVRDGMTAEISKEKSLVLELERKIAEHAGRFAEMEKRSKAKPQAPTPPPQLPQKATKPVAYEFRPVRDGNGFIQRVTATPIEEP